MQRTAAKMVEHQLRRRGIRDERVLDAMEQLPREHFVPRALRHRAYDDVALPLERGQTISQPLMVALSLQALELQGHEAVLEIGAGSGYQAALLGRLAAHVTTMEILPTLADDARRRLSALQIENVHVVVGNGRKGWPANAPYDAIVVAAASREVPAALVEQLRDGGRLVIPIGGPRLQELQVFEKSGDRCTSRSRCRCVFVPLVEGD